MEQPTMSGMDAAWYGPDLGAHRPSRDTYERYPCSSLPPLDESQFTGMFQWLGDPGEIDPEYFASLRRLDETLSAKGRVLPRDFAIFCVSSTLRDAWGAVSATGRYSFSVGEPLPSPIETGAYLVRFLGDDSQYWYLYLRPSGHVSIVNSHLDYTREYENDIFLERESDLGDFAAQRTAISWCAPSFEHFAFRFWLESRLWRAVHGDSSEPLDSAMREYLNHYKASTPGGAASPRA